ncbi:MAG TPA: UDP-glucose 4-epimerase GalE [Cryomorphaceae bacterium]|nr:UDP-glucose 4-epimerase GalE [Cryomorphaceae bacterium]
MNKILLTGGAGFIGSHIAVSLRAAGYVPIILDNLSNSEITVKEGLSRITGFEEKIHQIDCRDSDAILRLIELEGGISGIIHLAAFKAVGESVANPLKYYDNNVGAMTSILQVAEKLNIHSFVFSSSCTVYGSPDSVEVTEKTPMGKPFSTYGYTKQIGEKMIEDLSDTGIKTKFVSLRYFNPIGAHPTSQIGELPLGKPNNLIPFICQTAAGLREELTIFGNDYKTIDGTCVRDYIHVSDLAEAHVRALQYISRKNAPQHDVFNIGTGKGNSVSEIIDTFKNENGVDFKVKYGPRRAGDVEAIFANTDKASTVLNWQPEYTLADALIHAWNWQKTLKK